MSDVPPCFIGHWKFSRQVPLNDLVVLARQWSHHDAHYIHLAVRTISPNHVAIIFAYQPPTQLAHQAAYEQFLTTTNLNLKQRFGELYSGWHIDYQGRLIK